jgi:hypothetical protein
MNTEDIITALHKLSLDDVQKVRRACNARLSIGGIVPQPVLVESDEDLLLAAFAGYLQRIGAERVNAFFLKQRVTAYKSFHANAPEVITFLQKIGSTRVAYLTACDLAIDALVIYMRDRQHPIPISASSLLQQAHNIPLAIDNQFPGYAEAGLLKMLLRVKNKDNA